MLRSNLLPLKSFDIVDFLLDLRDLILDLSELPDDLSKLPVDRIDGCVALSASRGVRDQSDK